MKIGLSLTTAYPHEEPAVTRFQQLIQQVEAARDYDFHSVWVGDHHVTPHLYYQSVPAIARLSAHTGSMRIGPFLLLPLYHPVLLVEQMATLDVITSGRLPLMVALGWQPEAYAAFGIPWKERVARFKEGLDILRLLFAKDAADYRGRFHHFEAVSFQPKPVHGHIPLWIDASTEPAIRCAARFGDAWIIGPLSSLEAVKVQREIYKAAQQEYGKDGVIDEFPMRWDVFIGEARETSLKMSSRAQSGLPRGQRECVGCPDRGRTAGLRREARAATGGRDLPCADTLIVQTQEHILGAIQIIGEQVIPSVSYAARYAMRKREFADSAATGLPGLRSSRQGTPWAALGTE